MSEADDMVSAPARASRWAVGLSSVSIGLGLASLLGWILRYPPLSSFGAEWKPMAPSTSVLLIAESLSLGLFILLRDRRGSRAVSRVLGLAVVCSALALCASFFAGFEWRVELLGLSPLGLASESVGHMSPVTGGCVALLGFAIVVLGGRRTDEFPRRIRMVSGCAFAVALASFVLLLAYLMGTPALYGGTFVSPSLSTAVGLLLLSLAVAIEAVSRLGGADATPDEERVHAPYGLIILLIALAVGIITIGYLYYRGHRSQYRREVEEQITAIADLKVKELMQWRQERIGDASVFYGNEAFAEAVSEARTAGTDSHIYARVLEWLSQVQEAYGYDRVLLLDAEGRTWMSIPDLAAPVAEHLIEDVPAVLRSGEIAFLDFHRDAVDGAVYLGVLIPLFEGSTGGIPLGVLVLRIDPDRYLYDLIERWPTPSQTAETLLVRKDGGQVLFLNELRFLEGSALEFRRSLAEETLPAVMAVSGAEGIVEGIDYRGVPVLAAVRSVPGSPWALVARIDLTEVYAPLREQLFVVILVISGLLFSVSGGVAFVWRRQRIRFYQDRYAVSERLRESESRYHELLDSLLEGYQIIDPEYRYLYVNDAVARHGRRAREELLGRRMGEVYPGIEETSVFRAIERCMSKRVAETIENEFVYPDGTRAWFSLSLQPVPQGVGILSLDVTERKEAEKTLRTLNVELENRVAQRTRQLADSNKELEAFAYSVSHDLRAPLRAVDGFSKLLMDEYSDRLDDEGRRLVRVVRDGARKMDQLITDLLALSRATRAEIRRAKVDMTELATACVREAADPSALESFEWEIAPLPMATGDPNLLRQVWINLLSNAFKFSEPCVAKRIEVGGASDGETDTFFVRDHGVGFDPEYVHKLFGVFQRLHGAKEFDGTGIGLAIVQRIVHRHGGRVWAEGRIDGGATFHFSLPHVEDET